MKTATPELIAFLASARTFAMADLYTITLPGNLPLRYTSADIPVRDELGALYQPALIWRTGTRIKRGVEVDTLDVEIKAGPADTVNGEPLIPFVARGGFRGSTIVVKRAFMADWRAPLQGTVIQFAGRFSQMKEARGTSLQIAFKSWLELLNVQMPQNLYQPGCLHTLFDSGCTLSAAAFAVTGSIAPGGNVLSFDTDLAAAAGYYDQGRIVFTSGANAGLARSIKSQTGAGVISLALALPAAPASGDSFTAYPGCDHTRSTCETKFANRLHFRGFPYVPVAETSV